MSNPFFDFTVSPYRFVALTLVRSRAVNDRLDEVSVGFDGVKTQIDLKAPLASPTFTGVATFNGTATFNSTVTVPNTAVLTDNSNQAATRAFVQSVVSAAGISTLPLPGAHFLLLDNWIV